MVINYLLFILTKSLMFLKKNVNFKLQSKIKKSV